MTGERAGEPKLLVADDDATVRESIAAYLEDSGYTVVQADGGRRALERFRSESPALVLLDLRMPDMDGLEVLEELTNEAADTPVIIVSGAGLISDAIEALRLGAWDFITKPIGEMAILEHAVRRALERSLLMRENRRYREHLEEQIELRTGQLQRELAERRRVQEALRESLGNVERVVEGTIDALSLMGEMRDPYTAGHQRRVARLAAAIARRLGLDEERVAAVHTAGLLHDIGKISVPIEILTKPGDISDLEYRLIQRHPQVGYDILESIDFAQPIAEFVYQHHERLDGTGYPNRLKGEGIRLEARILAVADVVEAMSSHRPYRAGLGVEESLREIERYADSRFDPAVVAVCLRLFRQEGFDLDP
ncbi:HD domain-containing phosphohydrolase [Endothiovibrio diazotrophicus]